MIRHAIELLIGAIVVLAVAFLFAPRPVYAGECWNWRASWYGAESGNRTANGERFTGESLTAAHRTLPFGAVLIVQNVQNGQSVRVRINDRGPFVKGRDLDLSRAAARKIGLTKAGVGSIRACRVG